MTLRSQRVTENITFFFFLFVTLLDLLLAWIFYFLPSPGEPGERKERGDVTLGSERPSVQAR